MCLHVWVAMLWSLFSHYTFISLLRIGNSGPPGFQQKPLFAEQSL